MAEVDRPKTGIPHPAFPDALTTRQSVEGSALKLAFRGDSQMVYTGSWSGREPGWS